MLVGRDGELARVAAWLADRATGVGPPVLLISGEAGVGKTALLRAIDTGPAVLRAADANPWRASPFGVMAQLVSAFEPAQVRAELLGIAGGRELVVVLDDMQWSDEATLDLLPPLAHSISADPMAVVVAYRSDEVTRGHRLRAIAAELRHRKHVTEIKLGPLDKAGVAALMTSKLGRVPDEALVDKVTARSEGVPFFVEEFLAAGDATPMPETVRDAILLRTKDLSPAARTALDVAAVFGIDFRASAVAALSDTGWPDELDDGGLVVVVDADARRFRHALIQEAVYSGIPWTRRTELHLAIAARAADPAVAARHLLAGRDFESARPALLAAAARHEARHAYRDAATFLTQALETWSGSSPQRHEVVDRLARCAELSGDGRLAVTSLRELADRTGRAEVWRRLAVQHELLGNWPPALAARESAAEAYARKGELGEAAAERLAIAAHLRSAASFRAALEMLDAAEADAEAAARTDLLCRIRGLRGNVLSRMGEAAQGVALVRQALALALERQLPTAAAEVYQRLADSLEHAGDYRAAGRAYDGAFEFCQAHSENAAGQLCRACATAVMFHSGRWDRAITLCTNVLDDAAATPHARAVASGMLGLVQALRGQARPARAALLDSRTTARRIDLVAMEILSTWGFALLDEAAGHAGRATEGYAHVLTRCQETEERHYCVPVLQFASARFAANGAHAELGAATAILADAAVRSGQPEAQAALAHALGEQAWLAGETDAPQHFRRALELLDGLDLPIADLLVRQRLAETLSPSDERSALLREALATATRLKARVLVDRITPDLVGAQGTAGSALTDREQQIMRLVGDGMTSRAIAAQLFLSVRTVEMHVSNAVTKLGCRNRAEAVRRLAATQ